MTRRILQHIDKLDDSKFKPLRGNTKQKFQQLHDNLWSMFDLDFFLEKKDETLKEKFIRNLYDVPKKPSVTNFSWTAQVEREFENHPYHKKFIGYHRYRTSLFSIFLLDVYPCTME